MRSTPSPADRELVADLAADGLTLGHPQLERWRTLGLIPRSVVVREGFGGSRVVAHSDAVRDAARLLAQRSARGRPWQYCAIDVFGEGLDLSTAAVRGTARFLIELQIKHLRRAWRLAERAVGPVVDPDDELADLGFHAAKHVGPTVKRDVRQEVGLAHPTASAAAKSEAAERALIWRMVDIHLPGRMTEEHRNLARHGVEEPMDVFGSSGILPLPSERLEVAETLTWAEANVFRESAVVVREDHPHLAERDLFTLMTWMVTGARRQENFRCLDLPLGQSYLEEESKQAARRLDELFPAHAPA